MGASLEAQKKRNPHAIQETWVQSLGWEDPLENGVATHSSILAWRILWTEEPGGLQSMGLQRVRYNCATFTLKKTTFFFFILILKYSCLICQCRSEEEGEEEK